MSIANTTAIITGASSGIGRSLSIALAARGTRVGVIARRKELLDTLVAQIRASGGTVDAATADVADRHALQSGIRYLCDKLGPADLLIANAGIALPSQVGPHHVSAVRTMVDANFLGVVHAFDAVLDSMLQRGKGHLVAISSLAAYKGLPGSAGYSASKAAVNAYCEGLRIELKARGIAVTCVCPGFVDTAMTIKNPRPMPLLMHPDEAARRILIALRRKPGVFDFPWPMRLLMWLSKWAPDRFIAKQVPIVNQD